MSYATVDQLAEALETRVTEQNTVLLQGCLDAAAREIDWALAGVVPSTPVEVALVERTNVNRAVEWFKSPAAYNGGVGSSDTAGTIEAPSSGFERHAAVLMPLRHSWGLG